MVTRQHIKHNTTIHNTKANNIELGAVIDVIHAPQIQHTTGHTCTKPTPIATILQTYKAGPASHRGTKATAVSRYELQ